MRKKVAKKSGKMKATITPSGSFIRPNDTAVYASGDLVANSTVAGSVVPLLLVPQRSRLWSGCIRRVKLKKSALSVTLATFRLHVYSVDPSLTTGIANGDNGAWSTNDSGYLGYFDLDMTAATAKVFRDSAAIIAIPSVGQEVNFSMAGGKAIYGLLEARAAYVPAANEVFTVTTEVQQSNNP